MSSSADAAGAGETGRKVNTPKGLVPVYRILGHMVKSHMTVIARWGAIIFVPVMVYAGHLSRYDGSSVNLLSLFF